MRPGHIWPTHHEDIRFCGTHSVDVDGELAKLGSDGYRALRATAAVADIPLKPRRALYLQGDTEPVRS